MSTLVQKVALVTGGGRGIGRAIALALAQAGCDVAVSARTHAEIEQVAGEIRALGRRSMALTGDIGDTETVSQLYQSISQTLGPIDILINNAALVEPIGSVVTLDPASWAKARQVNLISVFHLTRLCLPAMLTRGWGRIVNISSGAGAGTGLPHGNAYSVSKAGLDMLTKNLAAELTGSGVTMNSVWPGLVDTGMQAYMRSLSSEQAGEQVHTMFSTWHAQGLLQPPAKPAHLVVNLLQSEITGEIIDIATQQGQTLIEQTT